MAYTPDMYGPPEGGAGGGSLEERKRALLARLMGRAGARRGDFQGRGLARGSRGGPPVGIMSALGATGNRGFTNPGGMGGNWRGETPDPRRFPILPPGARPPEEQANIPPNLLNATQSHPYMGGDFDMSGGEFIDPGTLQPPGTQHPWIPPWLRIGPPPPPPPPRYTPY